MKKFVFYTWIMGSILLSNLLQAQNVTITDDETHTADTSAILDLKSENKGFLIPRLTTTQILNISNPANGLLVFNSEEEKFYYYAGGAWIKLTAGNPDNIWQQKDSVVYFADTLTHFGIGTKTPTGKLEVMADNTIGDDEPLFEVKNKNGDPVFSVYPNGVHIYVDESTKGNIGGFAVSGRSATKEINEYMRVTPDSTRIYVKETAKGNIGGFAVSGRSASKGSQENYLEVTPSSTRIFVDTATQKGNIGGFAVSGRSASKGEKEDLFVTNWDSTRIYIEENTSKGNIGGFAVSGRSASKQGASNFFNVAYDTTQTIDPSEPRILWYPTKEAFLTGRVLVESSDSVGTNSFASGFEAKAVGNWSQSLGYLTISRGNYSSSIGRKALAEGDNAFALGDSARAMGKYSYAFGKGAQATGEGAFAFGTEQRDEYGFLEAVNMASGDYSIAIGIGTQATARTAVSIGVQTESSGQGAVAMGFATKASGDGATAIGQYGEATSHGAVALGGNSIASAQFSIAAGQYCEATASYATAIGCLSDATATRSTALGYNAKTNGYDGSIVIGDGSDYDTPVQATAENQFTVRAVGGYQFFSDISQTEDKGVFIEGNSGNVGIGTSSPTSKLHVNGVITTTNLDVNDVVTTSKINVNDVLSLEPRATAPSSASRGDMYFDSTAQRLMIYTGVPGGWKKVAFLEDIP